MISISRHRAAFYAVILSASFAVSSISNAQSSDLESMLSSGEFSLALENARSIKDPLTRDRMLQRIAVAQRKSDVGSTSFSTLAMIQDDDLRFQGFDRLTQYGNSIHGQNQSGSVGSSGPASRGGITEADFGELMDLIQETIDPDSWEENGGVGRMSPFPAGVWVDSSGTLREIQKDKTGRLGRFRKTQRQPSDNGSNSVDSQLRKISLARLETELQRRSAMGLAIPSDMQYLSGIYELKYVILYPETGDVVIAGPAGPYRFDAMGRAVNETNGRPVLNLDDLVVCLRNAKNRAGKFGCSIDPRPSNLAEAKTLLDTSTLKGKALRKKLHATLGQMDVSIEGIDATSHAASVIVEADYKMKLIGLGINRSVPGLANYFERIYLGDQGQLPDVDQLVRWWFTMNYESVVTNENRTIFEINGPGIRLLSESEFLSQQGERVHTGKSSTAAAGFAEDFTARFEEIAIQDPVFGQLKNLFDCAIAASIIHQEELDQQADWKLRFLCGSARPGTMSYQPAIAQVPTQVESMLGQRILTHREGGRTIRHTISGFGGGVEFNASRHTAAKAIQVDTTQQLANERKRANPADVGVNWSWD